MVPGVEVAPLLSILTECSERGVRGGAVHDFRHLNAASIHCAEKLYTLNLRHFSAFHRPGDPGVLLPW